MVVDITQKEDEILAELTVDQIRTVVNKLAAQEIGSFQVRSYLLVSGVTNTACNEEVHVHLLNKEIIAHVYPALEVYFGQRPLESFWSYWGFLLIGMFQNSMLLSNIFLDAAGVFEVFLSVPPQNTQDWNNNTK